MRVISRKKLRDFWEQAGYEDAMEPLCSWFQEAKRAKWRTPHDVKAMYKNASILKNSRVVFNIHGNKYRLVVKISFDHAFVYIRFIGTHSQYDKIDVETV